MLEPINQRVAGIDIHKKIAVITVLLEQANGEVEVCTREFATDPGSLVQATQWLASCAVELCIDLLRNDLLSTMASLTHVVS